MKTAQWELVRLIRFLYNGITKSDDKMEECYANVDQMFYTLDLWESLFELVNLAYESDKEEIAKVLR